MYVVNNALFLVRSVIIFSKLVVILAVRVMCCCVTDGCLHGRNHFSCCVAFNDVYPVKSVPSSGLMSSTQVLVQQQCYVLACCG